MKNFLINLSLSALSLGALHAQQVPGEASFGSSAQSLSNLSDQAKISVISSFGGTGRPGSNANVIQSGNQNSLNLNLTGNGNNIVTSQIGDLNQLNLDLNGSNSQYVLEQSGNSNELQMKNIKSSGINFQSTQKDGGNSLILQGGSIGSLQSMKIEQTGGMKIIIESNPIFGKP
ncbi:hypothetical protein [Dyadobacter psychrotolerans]|uniref:Curlin n=1 Tax=Dyadobacter psychrotolerans TaxID=2541721 RepID=A0A4R5DSR9_9BACT|nr:hypothetical protein [Dyadobacter psychrotolerans]TDE15320.1 hypothetical protein E0F88_12430 [Dyadobacter psychrotolerans]